MTPRPPDLLETTEQIAALLAGQGIEALVIGAVAMAAHRYVRHTEDVDLGVSIAVRDLARVASNLQATGYEVVCREPDGQDPLGGVIDVSGNFGLVQVVNFGERFPAIIESGLAEATLRTRVNGSLRIAPLPHLVGLKLYAGRMKSKADIVELLRCNPSADRDVIRDLCRRYRLRGLDPLIQEADADVRTSAPGSPGKPLTTNPPNPRSPPATFDTSFRRDGRPLGRVHLARARGGPVPSRRTLATGIHALRSLVGNLAFAILAALGFPTPARLARAHPSRIRIPIPRVLPQ